ncbi:MAG TPA: methyltransferase domain-containing protein [Chloroflexota bacterium]|nr:methyltransferase domain-containing protein [Chloroflexota bacterium]
MVVLPRRDAPELLDNPGSIPADLTANLRDIRFINRWFGGATIAERLVLRAVSGAKRASVLDVGTGSGDIPRALLRRSKTGGLDLRVTALDLSAEILDEARRHIGDLPVRLELGDARRLPFPDASFDVVLCSLVLHHFGAADAITVLSEMWRVANRAVVVGDLRRCRAGYVAAWLVTRTVASNRVTRHDGPLSVLRAYTPDEVRSLAASARLEHCRVEQCWPFRLTLYAVKG